MTTSVVRNNFAELQFSEAKQQSSLVQYIRDFMNKSKIAKAMTYSSFAMAAATVSSTAIAFSAPAAGDFGYNIYDIAVNKVADGPIGFVGGMWLIAQGSTKLNEGWTRALPFILGGSCLIKLQEITTSLGALIH